MLKQMLHIVVAVSGFSVVLSCVTNSEGRKSFNVIGDGQMDAMGHEAYAQVLTKARTEGHLLAQNSDMYQIVERIGRRIAKVSGVDFKWEFNVIDEPKTANAFCLPGGKIAVYTGILPVAKTEAALAVIIGHEVAHATMRHGAERMSQQLAIAGLASAAEISLADNRYRSLWLGALTLGAQVGVILPYSRSHESEADSVGLKYAAKAGYDPSVAPALWDRMGASGKAPPEFMSTHPNPANRSRALAEMQVKVRPMWEQSDRQADKPLPSK